MYNFLFSIKKIEAKTSLNRITVLADLFSWNSFISCFFFAFMKEEGVDTKQTGPFPPVIYTEQLAREMGDVVQLLDASRGRASGRTGNAGVWCVTRFESPLTLVSKRIPSFVPPYIALD